MKLLTILSIVLFAGGGQLQSEDIKKGKIEDFYFTKREHVIIFKCKEENKETKTISLLLLNRGTLMVNWDKISAGDSVYYEAKSDTLQIIKKGFHSDSEKIKVYFKDRSNKLKL